MFPAILGFLHLHPIRSPSSPTGMSCTPSDSIHGVHITITVLGVERPLMFTFELAAFLHFAVTQNGALRRPTTPYKVWLVPPVVELLHPFAYLGDHFIRGRSPTCLLYSREPDFSSIQCRIWG